MSHIRALLLALSIIVTTISFAYAETASAPEGPLGSAKPDQTVLEVTNRLRSSNQPSSVLLFVDWDEALKRTAPSARDPLKLETAKDLRLFYEGVYANSPVPLLRRLNPTVEKMPPEVREQLTKQLEDLAKLSTPQADARYARTIYEIKRTVVDQDVATVLLYATHDGVTQELYMQLVKKNDRWVLPCVQLVPDPLKVCQ